jgi:hypothetical protein
MQLASAGPAHHHTPRWIISTGASQLIRRILTAAALGSAIWLAAASPAAADEMPRLGLTPVGQQGAYFSLTLRPAESTQLKVEAANFGAHETVARTYAADVYSLVNGGFGAELFGGDITGTASWLNYPTLQLTLGPREATVVTFEIAVPAGTAAGQYIAALVIENAVPVRGSGPVRLDQVNRNAIAVAIDVPGSRKPALAIGGVTVKSILGATFLVFEVRNPGNRHLRPAGAFRLLDAAGSQVSTGSVVMDIVYAGTRTHLEARLLDPLPPGDYCVELKLTDPETGASAATECTSLRFGPATPDRRSTRAGALGTLPSTGMGLTPERISRLLIVGTGLVGAGLLLAAWRRRRKDPGTSVKHRGKTAIANEDT